MHTLTGGLRLAIVGGMTLQDLLKQHGITRIKELAERTGLSSQHAWNLWHAHVGIGTDMLKRLYERLQIPLEELIQIDPISVPKRKPRKRRQRRTKP
jgi:transcriptional regulator with XRE-family HTH domain